MKGGNPSEEQLWRDEVRYLHSLWLQGPPRNPNSAPTKNPNPKPKSQSLGPSNSIAFKKEGKINKEKKKNANKSNVERESITESLKETSLPESNSKPAAAKSISPEEVQERNSALLLHQNGIKTFRSFCLSKGSSDNAVEDAVEDSMEDNLNESEEFKLLLGIFTEDNDLRSHYEKHCEGGFFYCLVCGGIGKQGRRWFKSCAGLVGHSLGVTRQKKGHRAFGQAICKILGWDINQPPTVGRSLSKAGSQVDAKENVNGDPKENFQGKVEESVNVDNDELGNKENENVNQNEDHQDIVVDSLKAVKGEKLESQRNKEDDIVVQDENLPDVVVDSVNAEEREPVEVKSNLEKDEANDPAEDFQKET